jgi:hypothetical protein
MKKVMFAAASLALSGGAVAGPDTVPWTYIDAGYVLQSGAGTSLADEGGDGYKIRGSFGLNLFHFGGEWYQVDGGGSGPNKAGTIDSYDLYVGVHPSITEQIDLVVDIGYTESENDRDDKTDGVFLRVGPRAMIGEHFELSAYLTSTWGDAEFSVDDGLDNITQFADDFRGVTLQVGGQWYFTEHFSVGADARLEDIGDNVNLFARWSF